MEPGRGKAPAVHSLRNHDWLDLPDLICVFINRAVGREDARVRDVDGRRLQPLEALLVALHDLDVRIRIGVEILEDEELVVRADQVIRQRLEVAVRAVRQLVDDEAHVLIRVVLIPGRVGARRIVVEDFLRFEAEDDAVLVAADRITARGYGKEYPVADNSSPEGRAMNRRVEIVIADENGNLRSRR